MVILILWQLRKIVPSLEVLQKASKIVCTLIIEVSPDPLSPTPSTSVIKATYPLSSGPSSSMVEADDTLEEIERTLMPLNQQVKQISE